jgi:hypothetical protein
VRSQVKYHYMNLNTGADLNHQVDDAPKGFSRRGFLQLAGGVTAVGVLLASCRRTPPDTIYVGKDDIGVMNYLYVMETILAAVYTQANITPYYGMDRSELQLLEDLRDHQIAHRELLKSLLGDNAIPRIVTKLDPITFADRNSTLSRAFELEDMAVGAYTGAIKRLKDTKYVPLLAKMATVQARHAAYARDILSHNNFGNGTVIDANGFGQEVAPPVGMAFLLQYVESKLDIRNLPA